MEQADLLAAVAITVGLIGVVVPVLPGTLLVGAAILGWAYAVGGSTAWTLAGVSVAVLAVGAVVKYAVPTRRLRTEGIANRTLVMGAAVGVLGFFVVPVFGLFLGFVLGVYLSEVQRRGHQSAWAGTRAAVAAVGVSILIEAAAALLAACVWVVAVITT